MGCTCSTALDEVVSKTLITLPVEPFQRENLSDIGRQVTVVTRSSKSRGRLYGADVETRLTVECRVLPVTLKKSLIDHPQAGSRKFERRRFGTGYVVGYYYEALA